MPRCPNCSYEFESSIKHSLPAEEEAVNKNKKLYKRIAWYNKYWWLGPTTLVFILLKTIQVWNIQVELGDSLSFGLGLLSGGLIVIGCVFSLYCIRVRSIFKQLTISMRKVGYDTDELSQVTLLDCFSL